MIQQLLIIIILIAGLSCVIFIVEYLHKRYLITSEYTRKIAHILAGLSSLIFLLKIISILSVLFIAIFYFLLLLLSKKRGFLKSIDSISRKSAGTILFPVAIFLVFAVSRYLKNDLLFVLPVLILAVSDPLAGITGTYFRHRSKMIILFNVQLNKTIPGSTVFFLSTFFLSFITLSFYEQGFTKNLLISLLISIFDTLIEFISPLGIDNLTVPLMTILILYLAYI